MQATTIGTPGTEATGTTSRITALDFTKGSLVLFMVLYHWLNYFYSPYGDIYRYLRFLTPSFIFITGFLISHVYFAKYGTANKQLPRRLAVRGVKILGVFILLNVAIAVLRGSHTQSVLAGNSVAVILTTIFITGNVLSEFGKTVSFGILVPIGYLLLISALMLPGSRKFKYIFHAVCIAMFLCIFFLRRIDIQSTYLDLLAIGSLGVVLGYTSSSRLTKLSNQPYVLGLAYCGYLCAITFWDPYALRVAGVCLTLTILYAIGNAIGKPGPLAAHLIVLGRYSLFGYIWQIAILQLLHWVLGRGLTEIGTLAASFVLGFALTMASVEALDRLRPRSRALDQVYRVAFA